MYKISFIGAGSVVFARNLLMDILYFPELRDTTISLMDVDEERLALTSALARRIVRDGRFPTVIESTTKLPSALDGADTVIAMFDVGGQEMREVDVRIPQKYGVNQAVGDTLAPGGIFKALRIAPVLLNLGREMKKHCPGALLLNYTNPMAINCWLFAEAFPGSRFLGLCHGVEETKKFLSFVTGVPYPGIECKVAGINHMAWFLELTYEGKNLYPLLKARAREKEIVDLEPIRFELMERTGYFMTESSYHTAEYLPFFSNRFSDMEVVTAEEAERLPVSSVRKTLNWGLKDEFRIISDSPGERELKVITGWDVKRYRKSTGAYMEKIRQDVDGDRPLLPSSLSIEYAARIIHSLSTGTPRTLSANVINGTLIENLPPDCCVEVPCKLSKDCVNPVPMGELPELCAELNVSNVNVQRLVVEGILAGDRKHIYQAMTNDPLTSAVLSPASIKTMTDEMFEAEGEFIGF